MDVLLIFSVQNSTNNSSKVLETSKIRNFLTQKIFATTRDGGEIFGIRTADISAIQLLWYKSVRRGSRWLYGISKLGRRARDAEDWSCEMWNRWCGTLSYEVASKLVPGKGRVKQLRLLFGSIQDKRSHYQKSFWPEVGAAWNLARNMSGTS